VLKAVLEAVLEAILEAVLEARPLLEAEEVVRSAGPEIWQALPVFLVRLFTLPFSSIGCWRASTFQPFSSISSSVQASAAHSRRALTKTESGTVLYSAVFIHTFIYVISALRILYLVFLCSSFKIFEVGVSNS
jgi:hypothetical protein